MKDTSKPFNKTVGVIVKKARERHGMTQRTLAEKMDITTTAQCRREIGANGIPTVELAKYAAILGFRFNVGGYRISPGGQARRAE